MPQTPYDPNVNFSERELIAPADLDAEFANIKSSLDNVYQLLDGLLRSDDQLKDQLIKPWMLSPEVVKSLLNVTLRGPYTENTPYSVRDLVEYGGSSFVATQNFNSSDFVSDQSAGYLMPWSHHAVLDGNTILGEAAFKNIGILNTDIPTTELADTRYTRIGGGGRYLNTINGLHIIDPLGASNAHSSEHTGLIAIELPQSWKDVHFRMLVEVVLRSGAADAHDQSFTLLLTGRADSGAQSGQTANWHDIAAHILDAIDARQSFPVTFCIDSSNYDNKLLITLGDTATKWSRPTVKVRDIYLTGIDAKPEHWLDKWGVSFLNAQRGLELNDTTTTGLPILPNPASHAGKYLQVADDGKTIQYLTELEIKNQLDIFVDANIDSKIYARQNGQWVALQNETDFVAFQASTNQAISSIQQAIANLNNIKLNANAKAVDSDLLDGYDHAQFWKKGEALSATTLGGYTAAQLLASSKPTAGGSGLSSYYISIPTATGLNIIFCFGRAAFGNYDQIVNLPITYPTLIAGAWTEVNSQIYTEQRARISSNSQIIIGANSGDATERSWLTIGW